MAPRRDALQYRKADERVKAWAKAQPEENLSVGRWLLVKRKFARGTRVDVLATEAGAEEEPMA